MFLSDYTTSEIKKKKKLNKKSCVLMKNAYNTQKIEHRCRRGWKNYNLTTHSLYTINLPSEKRKLK